MSGADSSPMMPVEPGLPRFTGWLRPVVDAVAGTSAGVHRKLLFGFLAGALLLVGMAILSLVVIGRMNERVGELNHLQEKASRAQQMLYAVTAQSHFRAMALLTQEDKYNAQIAEAKKTFIDLLDQMEQADPAEADFFRDVRATNDGFSASSARALALYEAGDIPAATRLHLEEEHPASHVLEAAMRNLITEAGQQMVQARAAFESDRHPAHVHRDRLLGHQCRRGTDARIRLLVADHPPRPKDATRTCGNHQGRLHATRAGAEPR